MTPLPKLVHDKDERRACRRYALTLDLRYRITKGKRTLATGSGTTCDMSTRGIAFTGGVLPFGGTSVELLIDWPITLDSSPLKLAAFGKIIRADDTRIAILLTRHEFRLSGNRNLPREARAALMGGVFSPPPG